MSFVYIDIYSIIYNIICMWGAGKVYLNYALSCQSHFSPRSLYLQAEVSIFLGEYFVVVFFFKNKNETGYT